MNTKRVNAAADVIHRAMQQGKTLPASLATALDATCMLQSPETAAEQVELWDTLRQRTELLIDVQKRARQLTAEAKGRKAYGDRLKAENVELLAERHSTNEALSEAAEALRVQRDRIAELEARLGRDAEQRHLMDPLDHTLEALAPRGLPAIPQQLDRRAM